MQCKDPEDKIIAAVIDTLVDPKQVHRNVGMCAKAKLAQSKWLGKNTGTLLKAIVKLKGKKLTFTAEQLAQLGFSSTTTLSGKASKFDCSKSSILKIENAIQLAVLVAQNASLLRETEDIKKYRVQWSWASQLWDETAMKLRVHIRGRPIVATWQVLVMAKDFIYRTHGGALRHVRCTVPSIRLTGTSADKLSAALTDHDFTRPIQNFQDTLNAYSESLSVVQNVPDNATSNRAVTEQQILVHPQTESLPCFNHQTWIGEFVALQATFPTLLREMFGSIAFVGSGTNLVRCACCCYDWAMDKITGEDPSDADNIFSEEFLRYLRCWDGRERAQKKHLARARRTFAEVAAAKGDAEDEEAEPPKKKRKVATPEKPKHASQYDLACEYFSLVKGGYSGDRLLVGKGRATTPEDRATLATSISICTIKMQLSRKPPQVSLSKWVQGGIATDSSMMGGCNNQMQEIARRGLEAIEFTSRTVVDAESAEIGLEDKVEKWSKVTGSRKKLFFSLVVDHRQNVFTVGVVREGSRALALVFMASSADVVNTEEMPAVARLASSRHSLIIMVLNYYSALLAGASTRMRMLHTYRGCSTYEEWSRKYPGDIAALRRGASSIYCALKRRLLDRIQSFPMCFYVFGWVPDEVSLELCKLFFAQPRHKLRRGLALWFYDRFESCPVVEKPKALYRFSRDAFKHGGCITPVSVFKCESMHSFNRSVASTSDQTIGCCRLAAASCRHQANIAAASVVREKTNSLLTLLDRGDEVTSGICGNSTAMSHNFAVPHMSSPATDLTPKRNHSAEQLAFWNWLKQNKRSINKASVEEWRKKLGDNPALSDGFELEAKCIKLVRACLPTAKAKPLLAIADAAGANPTERPTDAIVPFSANSDRDRMLAPIHFDYAKVDKGAVHSVSPVHPGLLSLVSTRTSQHNRRGIIAAMPEACSTIVPFLPLQIFGQPKSMIEAAKKFKQSAEMLVRAKTVLEKPTISAVCAGLCADCAPTPDDLLMNNLLRTAFARCAKGADGCKAKHVTARDCYFSIRAKSVKTHHGELDRLVRIPYRFYRVTNASGRSGSDEADQDLELMCLANGEDSGLPSFNPLGKLVRPDRHNYVHMEAPVPESFKAGIGHGLLRVDSGEKVASELSLLMKSCEVKLYKVEESHLRPDTVVLASVAESFDVPAVSLDHARAQLRKKKAAPAESHDEAAAHDNSDDDHHVDDDCSIDGIIRALEELMEHDGVDESIGLPQAVQQAHGDCFFLLWQSNGC